MMPHPIPLPAPVIRAVLPSMLDGIFGTWLWGWAVFDIL